jgi:hypothetical protein
VAAGTQVVPDDPRDAVAAVAARADEGQADPDPAVAGVNPSPVVAGAEPSQAVVGTEPDPAVAVSEPDPLTAGDPDPAMAVGEPDPVVTGVDPDPAEVGMGADPLEVEADPDPAVVVEAAVAPAVSGPEPAGPPAGKAPDPKRRQGRRQRNGGLPPTPNWPTLPAAGGVQTGGSEPSRPQQPAAQARPSVTPPPAEPATPPGAPTPSVTGGREPEAAATTNRPGSGPLGVPPNGPEALLAAAEAAAAPPGPLLGTPARPPGGAPPGTDEDLESAGEGSPDRRHRGRRARSLLRFTAPKRPEATERGEPSSPDEPQPLADFDRLTASIESVTEALGGQPLEFYERDLPQIAAAETARRVRADVVVLLLDNGEGLMEVSGGVGLTPAERRLNVEYSRDVMRELFRAGVGLIEDTDRVRGALAGIPGSRSETLVMVPLVHERLGFGVLMAGRNRSQTGVPTEVFTDAEIEVLMGFADAAAASLRTAVLLRHLKGQLKALEEDG